MCAVYLVHNRYSVCYNTHTHFQSKPKGVEGLIDVENPNRVAGKMKKVKDIDVHAKVELSRRERYG